MIDLAAIQAAEIARTDARAARGQQARSAREYWRDDIARAVSTGAEIGDGPEALSDAGVMAAEASVRAAYDCIPEGEVMDTVREYVVARYPLTDLAAWMAGRATDRTTDRFGRTRGGVPSDPRRRVLAAIAVARACIERDGPRVTARYRDGVVMFRLSVRSTRTIDGADVVLDIVEVTE